MKKISKMRVFITHLTKTHIVKHIVRKYLFNDDFTIID